MGTDKTAFVEVVRGGATGSDVNGSHVAGSDVTGSGPDQKWSRALAQPFPVLFSYYSSSTKCVIAHDRQGYRKCPEGGSIGCEHAQPEIAQYSP